MKILAVDTATKSCSVAVMDEKSVIAEYSVNHNDTHSRFLLKMIVEVLKISNEAMEDLDGFAVSLGPGSFTGLRIGLSTVKGLALATGKPLVGISTLEALAYPYFGLSDKLICPMMDARRREVYTARYRFKTLKLKVEKAPMALRPEKAVEDIHEPCMMIGDGALLYKERIQKELGPLAIFTNYTQHLIRASTVGYLAMDRFQSHDVDDGMHMKPFYIRKSDAEKNLKTHSPK